MSGKAYTMKEMKAIVEYLTEHRAYGEIKGRKMWMDLASSKVTNRTWQSLKETFIKRILPDIHNPYYKLTLPQISSFRQGYDIEARLNNRLQIRSASQDSSSNGDKKKDTDEPEPSNGKNEAVKTSGEDSKQNKSDVRSSTETLVLDNCYETAEDIQRDLLSPVEETEERPHVSPTKSLKDFITYDEPLTPSIQAVINDFTTDEEGDESNGEPKMQIVEKEDEARRANGKQEDQGKNQDVIEILDSEETNGKAIENNELLEKKDKVENNGKETSDATTNVKSCEKDAEKEVKSTTNSNNDSKANESNIMKENTTNNRNSSEITQISNPTPDTLLPDNQEAFNETSNIQPDSLSKNVSSTKNRRKRAFSQENTKEEKKKKRLLNKEKQASSDTDAIMTKVPKPSHSDQVCKALATVAENKVTSSGTAVEIHDEQETKKNTEINTIQQDLQENVDMQPSNIENPCLQSVSLYAEQFSQSKYSDSDSNSVEKRDVKNEKKQTTKIINTTMTLDTKNEVVILKSHSDSASDIIEEPTRNVKQKLEQRIKQQRDKALANMFGFSSGGATKSHRRSANYRKRSTSHHQTLNTSSGSSDWTSDTGSEYISPPRGRRNQLAKKYLKPKSARILSLEEEGGLFVMYGKKIYPVVKDGKILKNYVNYTREDEVDTEESYWKLKYVEEKRKTAELTKLLKEVKDRITAEEPIIPSRVPVLPAPTENGTSHEKQEKTNNEETGNKVPVKAAEEKESVKEDKTVKIKFTKHDEEVQLEGHWSQLNPVLSQVMQLFKKEPESAVHYTKPTRTEQPKELPPPEDASGRSTPSVVPVEDKEIREKVNKIESEIFKEIAERDKEETAESETSTKKTSAENVTKRRGRPRKSSATPSAAPSPAKKLRSSESKTENDTEQNDKALKPVVTEAAPRRTARTPKKIQNETADENGIKITEPKRKPRNSAQNVADSELNADTLEDEDETNIKYKFPSPPPSNRKSYSNKSNRVGRNAKQNSNRYSFNIYVSPENLTNNSIESTQGYLDSDVSPVTLSLKKKRRMSFSVLSCRTRSQTRYRKIRRPSLTDDLTSESSNSFQEAPVKSMTFQNSTLKSEIYRSDSYQLLMPVTKSAVKQLEKIEEVCPDPNDFEMVNKKLYASYVKEDNNHKKTCPKMSPVHADIDSSSNITLPTSPALSIVENISISKNLLSSADDMPFDNNFQPNDGTEHVTLNELMKSEGDVSMPLMEQDCGIESSDQKGAQYHYNLSAPKSSIAVSDSLLDKVNTVTIDGTTLSETINGKMRNLILESTKKNKSYHKMDIAETADIETKVHDKTKQTKIQKRSSTPRKRQNVRKLKLSSTEPCIEEERVESCSRVGRKSCPPIVQVYEDNSYINEMNNLNTDKPKGRKKKDIIKVKITKPKTKNMSKTISNEHLDIKQDERKSTQTDSGINETESGIFLSVLNDDVDLIHNHSETCLNAHECMGESLEIVENSNASIISLDSKSTHSDNILNCNDLEKLSYNIDEKLAQELFTSDAQDGCYINREEQVVRPEHVENVGATAYHTPMGSISPPNSLLTEDLSFEVPNQPEARSTRWFLLSEDEASNTNYLDINQNSAKETTSYGANLNQIFPVTCAIPDLSTITEMSKENEDNTRKFSEDTNTRYDLDSQSLFNDI